MSVEELVAIIHKSSEGKWTERNEKALKALFGSPKGRYPQRAEKAVTLRAPEMNSDSGVPFAAYIHPANPKSGPYGGLSFVIFPIADGPGLIGLVIGTQGLGDDAAILGRPGHARKTHAIAAWLNKCIGNGEQVAWAKHDPTRTDINVPDVIQNSWSAYKGAFERYGREMYVLYRPTTEAATGKAVTALLDLMFEERGFDVNANCKYERDEIRSAWFGYLLPQTTEEQVAQLLSERRFVVLQGPPGTGKTRLASRLLSENFKGVGKSIQFHPNTTYENFVGGLAPVETKNELGLKFKAVPGFLMQAASEAARNLSKPYLLHVDEINRADLSKILGEAIYLLEPRSDTERKLALAYDFGDPFHSELTLPENLHLLGTMNSADRSIAIVDVAVRRRFGFINLWPQMRVVEELGCELMQDAFRRVLTIFVENASDDAFALVPGHSYFLERDEAKAKRKLKTDLAPLLEEYLAQGYITGFAETTRAYLQWLHAL